MLKLSLSSQAEVFRQEFRSWLIANQPPVASGDTSLENFQRIGREWQQRLSAGKWVGVYWPKEYGGRGLTLLEEAIIQEELVRSNAPQIIGLFGLTMVGPVLIAHGTAQQKELYLNKILTGEEIWCQGFSETGAGSDLASVKTRAVIDGNDFILTGHKVWTSFAHIAEWCFVLCRTSDEKKKHDGLTYLLVKMDSAGITTRPLKQISGDQEFNEVYFDQVRVPVHNVVGTVGQGWKIAVSTLMFERVVLTFARQLQSEGALRELLAEWQHERQQSNIIPDDTVLLAQCVIDACASRALAYDHLIDYADGKAPGPEGSLDKLYWSESFQRLTKLAFKRAGLAAILGEITGPKCEQVHRYLYSRGRTIAAGTSEIQRSIIAERLLGLPRSR